MHVSHLALLDFRSYAQSTSTLGPGVTAFIGPNGQGKTNLVEAIDYVSRLVLAPGATDAPLVRAGPTRRSSGPTVVARRPDRR